jgi:AcrR family transcriptional regulator
MPRTGLTAFEIQEKAIAVTSVKMREHGFDKVRLTDIAKELGLSHAALYSHFKDKTALFNAVSEQWLLKIDESLEAVCREDKEPTEKIYDWMLTLHRAKRTKVLHDPELYKAYDLSAAGSPAYVERHMTSMHRQLTQLVKEAAAKRRLKNADPEAMAELLQEALIGFHHPKMVAQHLQEDREPLLASILESVLKGLKLKV